MGYFMTYHSAYSAIVEGIVSPGMKERNVIPAGNTISLFYRVIVRVYRRWRHSKSRLSTGLPNWLYHILV